MNKYFTIIYNENLRSSISEDLNVFPQKDSCIRCSKNSKTIILYSENDYAFYFGSFCDVHYAGEVERFHAFLLVNNRFFIKKNNLRNVKCNSQTFKIIKKMKIFYNC